MSIDDQITILKSRGLLLKDEQSVREILKKENYYNLVNGYKTLFLDTSAEEETYLDGTNFEEIYKKCSCL